MGWGAGVGAVRVNFFDFLSVLMLVTSRLFSMAVALHGHFLYCLSFLFIAIIIIIIIITLCIVIIIIIIIIIKKHTGPICLKLTMPLVNVSLKF